MSKYIIEFTKTGTICYTSHLDLMRIFKRVFKRTGVALAYSMGFNPHPKMGFAQPLSLGYWGMEEYIEFETAEEWTPGQLTQRLAEGLPEGIGLTRCLPADHLTKTLAAHTVAAEYIIAVPVEGELPDARTLWHDYMDQEKIEAWKRQKKKKEPKLIDIRPMIREITFAPEAGQAKESGETGPEEQGMTLYIDAVLDCGSSSNLSPELVISSALERFGISTDRSEISLMRKRLIFDAPLEELLRGQ